ncbi:AC5 protein [Bhendi yellow vein India virus [India:Jalgov:OY124:2006]]|uniref:AC5 n=1 Tax=Bhendi yellow vein mosaic virus TaxID=120168 RepID=A0A386RW26_9GEMI|nr:AC5 protein [Bhendi yellow vein India virus [India:Jalgov:OY124:2006]]AYE67478.1 AC5 [Bhendi yellow vein mosaic virus]AYE67499.1 AC5 [Bhendi yellow vein mosaic virus]
MGTSHIKHQRILRMILVFSCFLLIVNNIIVNLDKLLDQRLFLTRILTTRDGCMPFPQHLVTIPMTILHGSRTGFVVKHVKYLTKILGFIYRSSITNKEKHHRIRMVLGLDVLVHPYLT